MEPTEFVTARLNEDQAAAEAAERSPFMGVIQAARRNGKATAHAHVARHGPARVLAQVAAMRAIVAEYELAKASTHTGSEASAEALLEPAVRHLATIWRGHDDYDPAWAPDA